MNKKLKSFIQVWDKSYYSKEFNKMVKNTTGGSKAKGQARKFVVDKSKTSRFLRVSQEEGEVYAKVEKMLGNGMCHVLCMDKITRICFIRGKFRGRGKKDNLLTPGTWILIGLREWENNTSSAINANEKPSQKCDLLEVYNDMDKERLKTTVQENWELFQDEQFINKTEGNFEFTDENTNDYEELIQNIKSTSETKPVFSMNEEAEIDINDI